MEKPIYFFDETNGGLVHRVINTTVKRTYKEALQALRDSEKAGKGGYITSRTGDTLTFKKRTKGMDLSCMHVTYLNRLNTQNLPADWAGGG